MKKGLGDQQMSRMSAWVGFLAMCLGMFMAILDIQIVASSLPEIQSALAIPLGNLSWVQTAYLIAEVIAIPLTCRLTRILSLSGLFVSAIAGFTLASLGCALSNSFGPFILFRVVQGFCGGAVIPAVFTAGFLLFPERQRLLATTLAGLFAMLAPTLGPIVGGYITETFSWHWLFLINIGPGILAVLLVAATLRLGESEWHLWPRLDYAGLVLGSIFLGSLEVLLKEGPKRGWGGPVVLLLLALCLASAVAGVRSSLRRAEPIVDLRLLADRSFTASCFYSFLLGMGLYGSVYLLPLFLGLVRDHTPLEIGEIMIVSGAVQLVTAPIAAAAERRIDPRLLAAFGYALFGAGLLANGFETYETDFHGLLWPQILRGAGVMFCLVPTTTIALQRRAGDRLTNASALFNLMRNLGGAIGISLVDTILAERTPLHVGALVKRLQAGDPQAALIVGLPVDKFHNQPMAPVDEQTKEAVATLVRKAGLVLSFNEAWLLLGALFVLALLALPLLRGAPEEPLKLR
jgi:MFS transporter, DHA2 family, multidrug resistance protein